MQVISFLDGMTPLSSKPYPFTQLQLDWLASLKSGKYKQGHGYLKDNQDGYCCLGVLCELAGFPTEKLEGAKCYLFKDVTSNQSSSSYLPESLTRLGLFNNSIGKFVWAARFPNVDYGKPKDESFGVEFSDSPCKQDIGHTSLGCMNDAKMIKTESGEMRSFTFREIADYIEFDPWNVFRAPPLVE